MGHVSGNPSSAPIANSPAGISTNSLGRRDALLSKSLQLFLLSHLQLLVDLLKLVVGPPQEARGDGFRLALE